MIFLQGVNVIFIRKEYGQKPPSNDLSCIEICIE